MQSDKSEPKSEPKSDKSEWPMQSDKSEPKRQSYNALLVLGPLPSKTRHSWIGSSRIAREIHSNDARY
jgi:hypothetical protein